MALSLATNSGPIGPQRTANQKLEVQVKPKFILLAAKEDNNYLSVIRDLVNKNFPGISFVISNDVFQYKSELLLRTKEYNGVFIANAANAKHFLPEGTSQYEAAGSVYDGKYCLLYQLESLYTVSHSKFLTTIFLRKLIRPESFLTFPKFTWERIQSESSFQSAKEFLNDSLLISIDIETIKWNLLFDCIAFSGLHRDGRIHTYVLDCCDPHYFERVRILCRTAAPKTMHNGQYDISYLLRFNCAPFNWAHDTQYWQHAAYSELPKSLVFVAAQTLVNHQAWKKENKYATSREERHRYNAKDSYNTLCVAITQLMDSPAWTLPNFLQTMSTHYPSLFCGLHGISANLQQLQSAHATGTEELIRDTRSIQRMVGVESFNAGSWQQVDKLLGLFGLNGRGTDEKVLEQLSAKHPLLERILGKILDVRANKKAIGTYYELNLINKSDVWEFNPDELQSKSGRNWRILYKLDPSKTETGRLASEESAFWCGTNIQNQPGYSKTYYEADEGFEFVEIDNEQSETRCTAYISQEPNLLATIESDRDFHTGNVELFFGVPYADARAEVKALKLQGELHPKRELAKRINHGKSYNMGPDVFVQTVGPRIIRLARNNLRLPRDWSDREVAVFLLSLFDKAYPGLPTIWYPKVVKEIATSNVLIGATGWTRYFFTQPAANKHALNAAIAHGPQSLSVMILNKGFRRCFWEIQLKEPKNFKLCAQIHDSVVAQVRSTEKERIIPLMKECLRNPVQVSGRTLLIPTDVKTPGRYWNTSKKTALEAMKTKKGRA